MDKGGDRQQRAWLSVAAGLAKQQEALEGGLANCDVSTCEVSDTYSQVLEPVAARLAAQRRLLEDVRAGLRHADLWAQNLPQLASRMKGCESAISQERAVHHAELLSLQQQEPALAADVEHCVAKLQPILASGPEPSGSRPSPSANAPQPQNENGGGKLAELEQFDAYVEEHGATGRWHPDDHAHFERVLRRNKGDYVLTASDCARELLGYKPEDISKHADWHARLVDLQAAKKGAIARWREGKRAETHMAALRQEASARLDALQRERRKSDDSHILREVQQRSVREWKEQQKAQQEQALQAERERKEAAEAAAAAKLASQREANQARLESFHKEKRAKAEAEAAEAARKAQEAALRLAGSGAAAARAQERSSAMLQRKAALAEQRVKDKEERAQRLRKAQEQIRAKIDAKVGSSAERVLQPTRAAQQRAHAPDDLGGGPPGPLFIRHLPSRAMPSWRRVTS